MSSTPAPRKSHSFFTYLTLSYLTVFAASSLLLYLAGRRFLSESARAFDRDDIRSESLEYAQILHNNPSGQWLAEEIALENFPPSTLFAIRILDPSGQVAYSASQPPSLAFPGGWHTRTPDPARPLPQEGWQTLRLPAHGRHIQVKSTPLPDGRVLQVAKSTVRERAQRDILLAISLLFFLLVSLFTVGNGVFMMYLTLRPVKKLMARMSAIAEHGSCETARLPVASPIAELDTLGQRFERMVQKNAALITAMKDTLDNVAHDFRTPLARIRNAAEFSLNAPAPSMPRDALLGILADIIEDCDTARLQLQNLLDVRSMESGFVTPALKRLSLKATVEEVADLYAVMAEDKNITLRTVFPGEDAPVDGDSAQLLQAVANLVDNAVKYTPRDGRVTLTLRPAPGHVMLDVSDSGIGIPPDERGMVWQRLYRGANARSEKGLGLGLSIVKAVIHAHGGSVSLSSAPGQGTTFTVTLPRPPGENAAG